MANDFNENLPALTELTNKLALELVYAEPGKDTGLLPVNNLLSQMEELCQAAPPPPALHQALELGRHWVNSIFETTGLFNPEIIEQLGGWATWLESAWEALQNSQPVPPLPSAWPTGAPQPARSSPQLAPDAQAKDNSPPKDLCEEIPLAINPDDADLLREFISESNEHLQNIELGVLVLEDNPTDAETLNSIFRAFHTFKGGSGLLNLSPINKLAHELESLLDLARKNKLTPTSHIIDIILEGGDTLRRYTVEIEAQLSGQKPVAPVIIPSCHLIHRVKAAMGQSAQDAGLEVPIPAASESKSAKPETSNPSFPLEASNSQAGQPAKPVETASSTDQFAAYKANGHSSSVKVATQKLDALVDLVGEMVIAQSLVVQAPELQHLRDGRLGRNLAQLSRITDELQRTAMSLRMVPIRSTFQKMNRLVRDLATRQGKQVELVLSGEDTELDRTIVEELNDPLVHMIRNSVDHGIEKPELRQAQGKPPQGMIRLSAGHQGGNIVIRIQDDGGGLNRDRILAKAIDQGLVSPNENLSDGAIFQLIFAPGFSTAEKVTDISGRGVGMDVVRRNIEKLRGKIEIESKPGQGSTFTIYLPLTLAIIDGLLVGVGQQRFILPTLLVRESFRPVASMISTVHGRGEMIQVRGKLSPMVRLHEYFNVPPRSTDPTQGIIVVVGTEREQRCLLVDDLLGKQEVVIKSLGESFKQNRAIAGAAILGDGCVGLILNVDYLTRPTEPSLKKAA